MSLQLKLLLQIVSNLISAESCEDTALHKKTHLDLVMKRGITTKHTYYKIGHGNIDDNAVITSLRLRLGATLQKVCFKVPLLTLT